MSGKTRGEKSVSWKEIDFMDYLSLHLTRPPTHREYTTHRHTYTHTHTQFLPEYHRDTNDKLMVEGAG